jgi:carboxylesterase type B
MTEQAEKNLKTDCEIESIDDKIVSADKERTGEQVVGSADCLYLSVYSPEVCIFLIF